VMDHAWEMEDKDLTGGAIALSGAERSPAD
jgi:hypothetical protein